MILSISCGMCELCSYLLITGDDFSSRPACWGSENNPERCPIRVYKKYCRMRPIDCGHSEAPFYLANHPNLGYADLTPKDNVEWFKSHQLGLNKISNLLKIMAKEASLRPMTNQSVKRHVVLKQKGGWADGAYVWGENAGLPQGENEDEDDANMEEDDDSGGHVEDIRKGALYDDLALLHSEEEEEEEEEQDGNSQDVSETETSNSKGAPNQENKPIPESSTDKPEVKQEVEDRNFPIDSQSLHQEDEYEEEGNSSALPALTQASDIFPQS